ncbi:MAG: BatA domain-containing protein [Limisphaerales bacterium]
MSFLNPLLLAGLAGIAIPVAIHLLNRRRFRRVDWAAMRFLKAALEKNRRRLQLEDALLLALRCLLVGLLAFALARPALRTARAGFLGGAPVTAVVILDASLSLHTADGVTNRFAAAREAASAALDALPAGSGVAVLLGGDRVIPLVPEPTRDLNRARQAIRDAAPATLATDHAVSIGHAVELLRRAPGLAREIVLVTDRQALGWRSLAEVKELVRAGGPDLEFRVVLVGEPFDGNLAVSALELPAGLAATNEPLRVAAEVRNFGGLPRAGVRLTLHVDDGPPVDEAVIETLEPGQSRRLALFTRLREAEPHALTARIAPDRLPADDARTLAVLPVGRLRVLAVAGPAADGRDPLFFVLNALQPVPPAARDEFFVEVTRLDANELSPARLAGFDVVVLANVPDFSTATAAALEAFVRGGGGLLVFPGPDVRDAFYNDELAGPRGLLPAALGPLRGDPAADSSPLALATGPYTHPLVTLWNDPGAGSLAAARVRAARELQPRAATNAAPAEIVLRLADGTPALVAGRAGRGRVFVAAVTADTVWSDLPVRPSFLPLVQRMLGELASGRTAALNVRAGSPVTVPLPAAFAGRDVSVETPDGGRRTVAARADPDGAAISFGETWIAGAYRVRAAAGGELLALFAVQADPAESDLAETTAATRDELATAAGVVDWHPGVDLAATLTRERTGGELWLPLVLAAVAVLLAETLLAQRCTGRMAATR